MNMNPSVWISAGSFGPGGDVRRTGVTPSAVAVATGESWQTPAAPCVTGYRAGTTRVRGRLFLQPR